MDLSIFVTGVTSTYGQKEESTVDTSELLVFMFCSLVNLGASFFIF